MTQIKARLREQARHNVRQAILDATRELFAQDGLAGVSMRGVAERADGGEFDDGQPASVQRNQKRGRKKT